MVAKLVKFALFSALTLGLTFWIAAQIVKIDLGDRIELRATFDDALGVFEGDAVKIAGVTVGEVTDIRVDHGRAVVDFTVDAEYELPVDTVVAVRWRNLIGQRFLGLERGESTDMLADGDTVEHARSIVDLGALVNRLAPIATTVSPAEINEIITAILEGFEGNEGVFDDLLQDLDVLLQTLGSRSETFAQLFADYETIADTLLSRDQQFQAILDSLVQISTTFADNDALIEQAIGDFGGFSETLDEFLTDTAGDFGSNLDHLATLADTAASRVDDLEALLFQLPTLMNAILPVVNEGPYARLNLACVDFAPGVPCSHAVYLYDPATGRLVTEQQAPNAPAATTGQSAALADAQAAAPATTPAATVAPQVVQVLDALMGGG
ncbi:MAG: MlaD family protein [Acidimicrobiales bacterium]